MLPRFAAGRIRTVGRLGSGGPSPPLPRGGDTGLGALVLRGASLRPRPADGSHLTGAASAAEEQVAAVGLEPRHVHAGRHFEPLQNLARSRIDPTQLALIPFPGA